jgi:hypothetical protein
VPKAKSPLCFTKHRLFEPFIANADITESFQAYGVNQMKGKIFLAELKHLLGNGVTNHLLGGHSIGSGFGFYPFRGKILTKDKFSKKNIL